MMSPAFIFCYCLLLFINIYYFRMIIKGYRKTLVFSDLHDLMPGDKCQHLVPSLEKEWEKELDKHPEK